MTVGRLAALARARLVALPPPAIIPGTPVTSAVLEALWPNPDDPDAFSAPREAAREAVLVALWGPPEVHWCPCSEEEPGGSHAAPAPPAPARNLVPPEADGEPRLSAALDRLQATLPPEEYARILRLLASGDT